MDAPSFDDLARAVGTRRSLLAGLAAAFAGGAAHPAAARRRRRECGGSRPCGNGFACRNHRCVCDSGVLCSGACCAAGQTCLDGQCGTQPDPACLAFGAACKNAGRACCDGLACGSGQGGETDVACYVPAGGACEDTSDCVYGSGCVDGTCVATPAPTCDLVAGPDPLANGLALKAAIERARNGDRVTVGPGEYSFAQTASIAVTVSLSVVACRSTPPILTTRLTGSGLRGGYPSLFNIASGAALSANGLALDGTGVGGKAAFQISGTGRLDIANCTVNRFNIGIEAGGDSQVSLGGGVRITNSAFLGCRWRSTSSVTLPTPRISCSGNGNEVSGSTIANCVWFTNSQTSICPTGCGCVCGGALECNNQVCTS